MDKLIHKRIFLKDIISILIVLTIGISGSIAVSDPIKVLMPKHPMISYQDWEGSQVTQKIEIRSHDWAKIRILSTTLRLKDESNYYRAQIRQEARWYASMEESAAFWNHKSHYPGWQIIENPLTINSPASRLSCNKDLTKISCDFEAYRGHWYTQIFFLSDSSVILSISDVERIVARANQLLMSVSE